MITWVEVFATAKKNAQLARNLMSVTCMCIIQAVSLSRELVTDEETKREPTCRPYQESEGGVFPWSPGLWSLFSSMEGPAFHENPEHLVAVSCLYRFPYNDTRFFSSHQFLLRFGLGP